MPYDSPWMAMGLRDDGYPVLDPRDFRTPPGGFQPSAQDIMALQSAQQALELRDKKFADALKSFQGGLVTGKEAARIRKALKEGVE